MTWGHSTRGGGGGGGGGGGAFYPPTMGLQLQSLAVPRTVCFLLPNGGKMLQTCICIGANCPGISGTVPDFLPVSWKGPEICFSPDCPGIALIFPKLSRNYYQCGTPPTSYDLDTDY